MQLLLRRLLPGIWLRRIGQRHPLCEYCGRPHLFPDRLIDALRSPVLHPACIPSGSIRPEAIQLRVCGVRVSHATAERERERQAGSESHVGLCVLTATYMVVVLPPTLDSMATANKSSNSSRLHECTVSIVVVIILSPGLSLLSLLLPFMFRNRLTTFHSFLLMLNTTASDASPRLWRRLIQNSAQLPQQMNCKFAHFTRSARENRYK